MSKQLSTIDIYFLVKELKQVLTEAKVDTIYHPDKKELLLQLHKTGIGKILLRILPEMLYLTTTKEKADKPSDFCLYLRKKIGNAKIKALNQVASERIVELVFEKMQDTFHLFIELFNKGNIILTDKDNIVISATEYQKQKERTIRPKIKYEYPQRAWSIFTIKKEQLKKIIITSKRDKIVTCLATELGLGGVYAEAILTIDKDKAPLDITEEEIDSIYENLTKLLKEKINPNLVFDKKENLLSMSPININEEQKNTSKKTFPSYNELLDYVKTNNIEKEQKSSTQKIKMEKLKSRIKAQEKNIKALEKEAEDMKNKAELIYQHYQTMQDILTQINKATKKFSYKEIKDKLKNHKIIKEINAKDKIITIDI